MSDIRKNKGKNSGQFAGKDKSRCQISDIRKNKGKETAKAENKRTNTGKSEG